MHVEIEWNWLEDEEDDEWHATQCLYTYSHPDDGRLLYIGKADRQSIHERLHGPHKDALFDQLGREFDASEVAVMHGYVALEPGRRLSTPLLSDIESLLIIRLRPPGNRQSIQSRIARPGLTVTCLGAWPWPRTSFRDN